MELYRLRAVLQEPSDETEGRYSAEIPDLPGCRAWGHTPAQALESRYRLCPKSNPLLCATDLHRELHQ